MERFDGKAEAAVAAAAAAAAAMYQDTVWSSDIGEHHCYAGNVCRRGKARRDRCSVRQTDVD